MSLPEVERQGDWHGRVAGPGWPREQPAAHLLKRTATVLLLAVSACIWWMSAPRLMGLDLPYPIAVLGASLLIPLAIFQQWALVTTDMQVKRGEEVRPVLCNSAFALAASAVLLSPSLVIAQAFGCPVLHSVGLVVVSDLGIGLLGAAVAYLADPSA